MTGRARARPRTRPISKDVERPGINVNTYNIIYIMLFYFCTIYSKSLKFNYKY